MVHPPLLSRRTTLAAKSCLRVEYTTTVWKNSSSTLTPYSTGKVFSGGLKSNQCRTKIEQLSCACQNTCRPRGSLLPSLQGVRLGASCATFMRKTQISFVSRLAEIFNRNRVRRIKERKVLMRRPSSTGLNCYLCAFVGKPNVRVMEKKLVHVHVLVNAQ